MKIYPFDAIVNPSSKASYLFKDMIRKSGIPFDINKGPWIAGGSILSGYNLTEIKDFDIFFKDEKQFQDTTFDLGSMRGFEKRITFIKHSGYADTWDVGCDKPVQLVFFEYYNNAEAVINGFDFTICQFVTDGKVCIVGDNTLEHIQQNKLVYERLIPPVSALLKLKRIIKYTKKGYELDNTSAIMFLKHIADYPECIHYLKEIAVNYEI